MDVAVLALSIQGKTPQEGVFLFSIKVIHLIYYGYAKRTQR